MPTAGEALIAGLPELTDAQLAALLQYVRLLADYGPQLGLTGLCGEAELTAEAVLESARLLELGPCAAGARCADIGSGAGIPVVTLAVLCPQARFTAIEPRWRRAAFLRQCAVSCRLSNLDVQEAPVEQLAAQAGQFELVTSRAFAKPAAYFAAALPLLAQGGEIRGYYGPDSEGVEAAAHSSGLLLTRLIRYAHAGTERLVYRADRALE